MKHGGGLFGSDVGGIYEVFEKFPLYILNSPRCNPLPFWRAGFVLLASSVVPTKH